MKHVPPMRGLKAFTCPHCGVYARHYSYSVLKPDFNGRSIYSDSHVFSSTICENCEEFTLWVRKNLVFPLHGGAPFCNPDIPDEVKRDYDEANAISMISPRASAALLRLAIQKLCKYLGCDGSNINEDIAQLVKKGLHVTIQQSLDIVRVIGNNAVHPGQINVDNRDVVMQLFALINLIAESMITVPQKVESLYDSLPEGAREAISKRDGIIST